MDLLIVNCRIMWFSSKSMIASGPLAIGSYLDAKGFDIGIIDDNSMYRKYSLNDFIDYIETNHVDMIGFSVNTLNAYNSYALAKALRERYPDKILLAGGLQSYDVPNEMIAEAFDIVFKGEAEVPATQFLTLAKDFAIIPTRKMFQNEVVVSKLRQIPGLLFKSAEKIIETSTGFGELLDDLDEVPFGNYDLINLHDYIKTKYDHHAVTNQINFQRGCPYACTFCKSGVIASKMRNNSGRFMVGEIKSRFEKFKLSNFFITDSNFTISKARLLEFCDLMKSSGLAKQVHLMVQTSIAIPLSDDEIELMQDAGVTMFLIGVERFGEANRQMIQKAGTGKRAVEIMKKVQSHGLKSIVNILVNFPFETQDTIAEESRLVEENLPYMGFLYINFLSPMPGTSIYTDELDEKYNRWYLKKEIATYEPTYYDLANLIEGPLALKLNMFNLSPRVIRDIRRFKERYQLKGNLKASRSWIVKSLVLADALLGKMSYYVAKVSPKLERILFMPFQFLRTKGYKVIFNMFVVKDATRVQKASKIPLDEVKRISPSARTTKAA